MTYAPDDSTSVPTYKQKNLKISVLPALIRSHGPQIAKLYSTSFEDVCKRFSKPRIGTKDGPAYVFTTFKDNHRLKQNAQLSYCLVFDFDNDGDACTQFEMLEGSLRDVAYLAHSSYSNSPIKPRFRLILPLAEPVLPGHYSAVFLDAYVRLGAFKGCDLKAAQPERAYYLPACAAQAAPDYWVKYNLGTFWEYDLAHAAKRIQSLPDEITPTWKDRAVPLPQGDRNDALFRLACSYRNRDDDEQDAWLLLSKQNDTRCNPPLPESELRAIIKNVYTRYPAGNAEILPNDQNPASPATPAKKKKKQEEDQQMIADNFLAKYGRECVINYVDTLYLWEEKQGLWVKYPDVDIRQMLQKCCIDRINAGKVEGALKILKAYTSRRGHQWNCHTERIPVANGEIIKTPTGWKLQPHARESYFTYKLPVAYDLSAKAPRFAQFLDEIFRDHGAKDQYKQLLLEAMGYTLTCSTAFHKGFWLVGHGSNGKSVFLGLLTELIGPDAYSSIPLAELEVPHQRAHLEGKLANIVNEVKPREGASEGIVKTIISGDSLQAAEKYKPSYVFKPTAKMWFATNELPRINDHSEGFFRRAIVFDFRRQFIGEARDIFLPEKLKQELPGILKMALDAAHSLFTNQCFTEFEGSNDLVRDWKRENNPLIDFADTCLVPDPKGIVSVKELHKVYLGYLRSIEQDRFPLALNRIVRELRFIYPQIESVKTKHGFKAHGIRFSDDLSDYNDPEMRSYNFP